ESGLRVVSGQASPNHDHGGGLAARHPPQLQGRDQHHRGRERAGDEAGHQIRSPKAPPVTTLGFVGLGAMGARMARRLLDAGYGLWGYNRTASKAAELVRAGMTLAASPREVAANAEAVFTMVTDDAALEAVTRGPDGILAGMHAGSILIEMSTVSPVVIEALAREVAGRGGALLAAPGSGGPATPAARPPPFLV